MNSKYLARIKLITAALGLSAAVCHGAYGQSTKPALKAIDASAAQMDESMQMPTSTAPQAVPSLGQSPWQTNTGEALPTGPGFASGYAPAEPPLAPPIPIDEQRIAQLEHSVFGSNYPEHELPDRLEHLEREVFGAAQSTGTAEFRLGKLESKVGGQGAFGHSLAPHQPTQHSYQAPPAAYRLPPTAYRQDPATYQQAPAAYRQAPAGYQQAPPGYRQAPAGYQQAPPGYRQAPSGYQQAPVAYQQAPAGYQQAPTGYRQAPTGYQQAPTGYQQAPTGYQQAPAGYQQAPAGYQQAPAGYQQPQPPAAVEPVEEQQIESADGVNQTGDKQASPIKATEKPINPFQTVVETIPFQAKAGDYFPQVQRFSTSAYAHWTSFPIKVHVPMSSPAGWKTALETGIRKWGNCVPIVITPPQEPADIEIAWINHLQPRQLGTTNLEIFSGHMRVTVYLLRPSYYPPGVSEKALQQVASHQMGHALGIFGHSPIPDDVMHPLEATAKGPHVRAVSQRDMNTLRQVYQSHPLPQGFESAQPISWP